MNKTLKLFTPLILSIFLCGLIAGQGWGEVKIAPTRIFVPDYVDAGKAFPIKIIFNKEVYLTSKYSFNIVFPERFGKSNIDFPITKGVYEFIATAPTSEGKDILQYVINDQYKTIVWTGSSEVNVIFDNTPTLSSVIGGVIMDVVTLPLKIIEGMGKSPSLLGGAP